MSDWSNLSERDNSFSLNRLIYMTSAIQMIRFGERDGKSKTVQADTKYFVTIWVRLWLANIFY